VVGRCIHEATSEDSKRNSRYWILCASADSTRLALEEAKDADVSRAFAEHLLSPSPRGGKVGGGLAHSQPAQGAKEWASEIRLVEQNGCIYRYIHPI
jgi:hypothetical protein